MSLEPERIENEASQKMVTDVDDMNNMEGFKRFHLHADMVALLNEQRTIMYYHFGEYPVIFNRVLRKNNLLRTTNIALMLDDAFDYHSFMSEFENEEELDFIERVMDLAEVQDEEQANELVTLLWKHWTSDDEEESKSAKEELEKQLINQGKKYAFVLSEDSRGLDVKGLSLLECYAVDHYDEDKELVFIEDEITDDPKYLARKMAACDLDCYVFILHGNKHFMECITERRDLFLLGKTLLSNADNEDNQSWDIAMHYVMANGIEPVSIDELEEKYLGQNRENK